MKKLLYVFVGLLAIASLGLHSGVANAQTASAGSQSNAALEQELQVAKATLINLEMKAGMIPAGDDTMGTTNVATPSTGTTSATPTASTGLSTSDRAALSNALSSLVSALSSLNATLAANPTAAATHQAGIASVLSGMQRTLVAMNSELSGASMSGSGATAPIAATKPAPSMSSGVSASNPSVAVNTQPSTGSLAPSAAPSAGTTNNQPSGNAPQTAQASNAWSFVTDHWPTITIVILVALILLILFWPGGEDDKNRARPQPIAKPQMPNRPVTTMQTTTTSTTTQTTTPVSTVAGAPAQKVEVQQSKVTVIRPQPQQPGQQQKRPA